MSQLGDDFRKRSEEQHAAALRLLELPTFATDPKTQVMFVVGKVTANMLQVSGEMVDVLQGTAHQDAAAAHRAKILEKSNGIRNAAAASDWGTFDRLVREFGGSGTPGGDGTG